MLVLDEDNSLIFDEDDAPDIFDMDHTALDLCVNDYNDINDEKHSNTIIKSRDSNNINTNIISESFQHVIPPDKKACSRCTFHNDLSAKRCEICEYVFSTPGEFIKPPVNIMKSMKLVLPVNNIHQQESCMAQDPRELLSVGDNVQIYSDSGKKWCKGKITKICFESNGEEWLTVKYARNTYYDSQKQIGRFSDSLQPMEVNVDTEPINMFDMQKRQSLNEFVELFPSKTRLRDCKPEYFIQILSIVEENVTIRLNVSNVDSEYDRSFIIRDIDKDFELQRIVVEKNWNYGICKLFIWDDIVGDSYHIAVYNRQNKQLSNDIRFTKYRNDEYPPPKPIDAHSITQVINKNEILLYWSMPNEIYGDNISYEIIFNDDEKKDIEIIKTLPYALKFSRNFNNSETQIRVKTIVTIFEDGKYEQIKSECSPFIQIGNIQQVFNQMVVQFMNKWQNDKADQEQRIQNLEQIKEERDKYFQKLNVVMENILSQKNKYDVDEELQCKIREVYNDKYQTIFFKKFVKEISMLFFDAKAIHSAYITHRVPIKSKKLKAVNKVADCMELINNFVGVPFVTNVIKIYKGVARYGYDKYVLRVSATNTNDFELKYCKFGGMSFAKQIGVSIVESNCIQDELKQIDDMKKDKENKKEIEKIAQKYSGYLLALITTGYADTVMSKLDFEQSEFINVMSVMVLMQKIKKSDMKFEDAWNKERIKDLTRRIGKNAKGLMVEFYYHFGTEQFLKNVIDSAKQLAKQLF
eukprot:458026_1